MDITDDLSDDASQPESQLDFRDEPNGSDQSQDQRDQNLIAFSTDKLNSDVPDAAETSPAEAVSEANSGHFQAEPEPGDPRESWDTKTHLQDQDEYSEGTWGCFLLQFLPYIFKY